MSEKSLSAFDCDAKGLASVLVLLALAIGAWGCTHAATSGSRSDVVAEASAPASVETTPLATEPQVRALLDEFSLPEEAGDRGYELLGAYHNDEAGWTRAVVLGHTDYGLLVRSIAAQESDVSTRAISDFERMLASKGATATYDRVVGAEWKLEDNVTLEEERLNSLVPASTFLAGLFDRHGRLAESYTLKRVSVSGDVVTLVYAKSGSPEVVVDFVLTRHPDGSLRIAGVRNYPQFKKALARTEITLP